MNTGAATVSGPSGVVVDHVHGKIYWANTSGNKISWARLDGSGGADLNTGTATVNDPLGVAIDSAAGKIYWANYGADKISFARLDNRGGGDLSIVGATVSNPWGVVIDSTRGRIYWGNFTTNALDYAKLDGTGGGVLATTGASQAGPMPGSIDPATGRIYWSNWSSPQGILSAKADGSGGGGTLYPLSVAAAMPVVFTKPAGAGAPAIIGSSWTGAHLSCTKGRWRADLVGELLYRAPAKYTFRWTKNGSPISGATASTFTPRTAGTYRCTVTASNAAGSVGQTSAPLSVWAPRPDAMIKKHTATRYTGNNVYNITGSRQGVQAKVRRSKTVTFDIRVQNDTRHADSFKIKGPGNKRGAIVHYLAGVRGSTDITYAVVHGIYRLRNVAAGHSKYLRLTVKAKAGARIGALRSWLISSWSTHDTTRKDAVKAVVRVVRS